MAYENGEETVPKMQTLFIIWVFQKKKKFHQNTLNNNSQKACHGNIAVNGTSIIWYAKYNKPSLEGVAKRQHYINTQPVWASENMLKDCRYISGCLEQT